MAISKCRQITTLILRKCSGITSQAIEHVANLTNLEVLDISQCLSVANLTPLSKGCPKLSSLNVEKLQHLGMFLFLAFIPCNENNNNCRIIPLLFEFCAKIWFVGTILMFILEKSSLMELRKCPLLSYLNITDCRAIDEELMQSLTDSENWVSLEELRIGGNKIPDSADDYHVR